MRKIGFRRQTGVSMIETLVVFPIVILMGFGIVHLGLVYQARANLEYAALMGARIGSVSSIDIGRMRTEIAKRLDASRVGPGAVDPNAITITILNPSVQMFLDCGEDPTDSGACDGGLAQCEIPFYGLQFRPTTANCDGVSIQDANILRIKVTYAFDSKVPFMNMKLFATDDGDLDGNDNTVDINAVATVRMQTPARMTAVNEGYF